MPFLIKDAFLPATVTAAPMTDDEFAAFCAEHPDLNFEMSAEGEIIIMAPAAYMSGVSNNEVSSQLRNWARKDGRGIVSDSSAGFVLPNGARRSPDTAWVLKSRIGKLEARKKRVFLHLCPDFVIEVKSESDRLRAVRDKMREYIENGAQLGWLIDPAKRTVEVYRPDGSFKTVTRAKKIEGEGPVAGFVLDLTYVWDPLAD